MTILVVFRNFFSSLLMILIHDIARKYGGSNNPLHRHTGEGRYPESLKEWIPAKDMPE
jgi:hypothetical protein